MAGIWNVNSVYNSMQKKISGKISFQIGENIALRIVSKGEDGKSIVVRTLDGWVFPALLEEPLEFSPDMLIRMQVSGYEDGKLKLKVLSQKHNGEAMKEESLAEIAKGNNLQEEDVDILKSMVKYTMPLTRENISRIKSLSSFMDKIKGDDSEPQQFITRYLAGKNIGADSEKGKEVANTLKDFFQELKTLSLEDILCMEENEMELTTENIKSFKNIVHESGELKASLETLKKELVNNLESTAGTVAENVKANDSKTGEMLTDAHRQNEVELQPQTLKSKPEANTAGVNPRTETLKDYLISIVQEKMAALPQEERDMLEKQLSRLPMDSLETALGKQVKSTEAKEFVKATQQLEKKVRDVLEIFIGSEITFEDEDVNNIIKLVKNKAVTVNLKHRDPANEETVNNITAGMKEKLDEVKNVIKSIINMKSDVDSTAWKEIAANVKANINDLKAFNSISGQYYYMDTPLKVYEKEYPCKLIIKDDRKKGKKIDSTNVKMALSIATTNMGTVDALVAVKDKNMKIDFKCEEKWMKIFDMAKEKLWKILSSSGYNISIDIYKKEMPMTIVSCRDFFEGNQSVNINVKV